MGILAKTKSAKASKKAQDFYSSKVSAQELALGPYNYSGAAKIEGKLQTRDWSICYDGVYKGQWRKGT